MSYCPSKLTAIDITTIMGCSLQCHFCPQKTLLTEYSKCKNGHIAKMTMRDFDKILLQVKENGMITFSGMSEVFQNENTSQMIKKAYDSGYRVSLFTTLMGVRDIDLEIIEEIEFVNVVLHIPDEEGNSKFIINDDYIKHLKIFLDRYPVMYFSCHGTPHSAVKQVIEKHQYPVDSRMFNRGGLLNEGIITDYLEGEIVCVGSLGGSEKAIGHIPVVLPNGTLLACPNDYGMQLVLGNLLENSWEEIINSKEYDNFEKKFESDSTDSFCRQCHRACKKEEAILRGSNLIWNHAVKVGRVLEKLAQGNEDVWSRFNDDKKTKIEWLINSEQICIFGLGKLFFDTFDKIPWRNAIFTSKTGICSDNDRKWLDERYIFGLQYVEPRELSNYDELLVITYVVNDEEIKKQLSEMGIRKIINIYEIFNILD